LNTRNWNCTSAFKLNSYFHELLSFQNLLIILRAKNLTLKKYRLFPQILFVCFILFSETRAVIFPYSIKELFFVTERKCVYSEVRARVLNKIKFVQSL